MVKKAWRVEVFRYSVGRIEVLKCSGFQGKDQNPPKSTLGTMPPETNLNDFGSGVLELISRSELNFRRRGNYFHERFEFWVCSKFNHMQRDCACACAVACLHPHNSISNVVVSVTIEGESQV